jgi:hypothetical protein
MCKSADMWKEVLKDQIANFVILLLRMYLKLLGSNFHLRMNPPFAHTCLRPRLRRRVLVVVVVVVTEGWTRVLRYLAARIPQTLISRRESTDTEEDEEEEDFNRGSP